MPNKTKIVFVEDDAAFAALLVSAVAESSDMHLLGSAGDVKAGSDLLRSTQADVLLVDLGLPDGSGLQLIEQARVCWPGCEIMVISVFGDKTSILSAIAAGASGYLLKDSTKLQVAEEIRTLLAGGSAISPSIARELLNHVRQVEGVSTSTFMSTRAAGPVAEPPIVLTQRQYEVLVLVNKGLTCREIATVMSLSVHTVRTYVKRAYQKLQVTSKSEALYELQRAGTVLE